MHALAGPLHWRSEDWEWFWIKFQGVLAAHFFLDDPARIMFQRETTVRRSAFFRTAKSYAEAKFAVPAVALTWAIGSLGGSRESRQLTRDLFTACAANALWTCAIKYATGRSRPRQAGGSEHFEPFRGHNSFPSGHTSQAFAMSAVIAEHHLPRWVKALAWTAAGMVGVARVYADRHYVSDVLAGAFLGVTMGHSVTNFNKGRRRRSRSTIVAPVATDRFQGLAVTRRF